jgi:hypothetical protein
LVDVVGANTALKEAALTPVDPTSLNIARDGSLREGGVTMLVPPHPHVLTVSIPTFSATPITRFEDATASLHQPDAPVVYMRTTMPLAEDGHIADHLKTNPTLYEVRFWIIDSQ